MLSHASWARFTARAALACGAVIATALSGCALPASGLALRDPRVVHEPGALTVLVAVDEAFGDNARHSLARGMPASLEVTADLWRERRGWFDEHVAAHTTVMRVHYDAWRETYALQIDMRPVVHRSTLEEIEGEIETPRRLPLLPASALRRGARYYVVFSARSRPLTPEGLREIEDFLSTQATADTPARTPSLPALGQLPRSFVTVLAAFSGLGEETARAQTPPFVPR